MALPAFNEHGLLPPGLHFCTMEELGQRFGSYGRRNRLIDQLTEYVDDLRGEGVGALLVVDGSFITNHPQPNDIDLVLILPDDMPDEYLARPSRRNLVERYWVSKKYREELDLFVLTEGKLHGEKTIVEEFRRAKNLPGMEKGLAVVTL